MVESGPPPGKNGHFLPKNGLKMPVFGEKQCFSAQVGSSTRPHTILQMLDSNEHVVQG